MKTGEKLDEILAEDARLIGSLREHVKELTHRVNVIEQEAANHVHVEPEQPSAEESPELPQEDFEAGITKTFNERAEANTTRMDVVPDPPNMVAMCEDTGVLPKRPNFSDVDRRRMEQVVDALARAWSPDELEQMAASLDGRAATLRREAK